MADQNLELFRRQYLQLVESKDLSWPPKEVLRDAAAQAWLYNSLFNPNTVSYVPPERYQIRILKRLLQLIEDAINDPDEDEISDDLSSALALLMSKKLPAESTAAQIPSYVTYTFSKNDVSSLSITLLESQSIIASSGTTGRRTWEAALHLSRYLVEAGSSLVTGKRILELGAGTGIVSILCARWLDAQHVTATDGSDSVVEGLQQNLFLNSLEDNNRIYAKSFKWGRAIEESESGDPPEIDVVLGADITYDAAVAPYLVSTFRQLLLLNKNVDIVIAATIRNADTFSAFTSACERASLGITDIDFSVGSRCEQTGPFYSTACPIRIVRISQTGSFQHKFSI